MSTSLGEVRDQVLFLTSRADRRDAIDVSINNVCRKLGGMARTPQALYEQVFTPLTDYLATGSTTLLSIPTPDRFNGISYGKLADGCPLDPLYPNQSKERTLGYGYYVSGANLLVNSGWDGSSNDSLLLGWYLYPPRLILDSDTHWVLDRLGHLVVDITTAYVLTPLGDTQSAQALLRFASAFQQQELSFMASLYEDT